MQHYYEVIPSRAQALFGLATCIFAAATIYFFVDSWLLKYAGVGGIALAAQRGYRRLIRQEIIRLRVDPERQQVEFEQSGQTHFYRKNKVYQTRWFAILRLIDQPTDRVLILNSDCFFSIKSYRRLRFDLRRLERDDAA